MVFALPSLRELLALPFDEIIDVRSPAEFAEDHIPGAINLPVLDDEERARVGTLYKQVSPFTARKIGAALVARRAGHNIETHLLDRPGSYRPLVYCWRGGMRSGAFATILSQIGWRAETLEGGYRTFRRAVVDLLYAPDEGAPALAPRLVVLDGNTGTAKTEILHRLAGRGAQVLDLEGLAHHRGSLFGAMPEEQPAQKAFDSAIALQLVKFDPALPVLVEAESSRIGRLSLPNRLWSEMRQAPRIRLEADAEQRGAYLARVYADIAEDRGRLGATIDQLRPYHPADLIKAWHALAHAGQTAELARDLVEHHYDPKYARQRARDTQPELGTLRLAGFDSGALETAAGQIMRLAENFAGAIS